MRKITFAFAAVLGLLAASTAQAAITLNFAANQGSDITFVGAGTSSTFNLTPQSTPQFTVTTVSGGTGSGVGITGSIISAGGFTYQQSGITTSGTTQTAALTGSGTLTLVAPGGGETVTGTITGINVSTNGTSGGTNTTGTVNITNLAISGSGNADLTTFYNQAVAGGGIGALTFQFIPSQSLTQLLNGTNSTSYSGTVTAAAVPEPGTLVMAFVALPLLGIGYRLRRRKVQV